MPDGFALACQPTDNGPVYCQVAACGAVLGSSQTARRHLQAQHAGCKVKWGTVTLSYVQLLSLLPLRFVLAARRQAGRRVMTSRRIVPIDPEEKRDYKRRREVDSHPRLRQRRRAEAAGNGAAGGARPAFMQASDVQADVVAQRVGGE